MPRIPDAIRRRFGVIAVAELLCWAVVGVFSAVIASLMGSILHTGNLGVTAGALFVMIGTSALAQLAAPRLAPLTAQVAGLSTLAAGLVLLLAAEGTSSAVLAVLAMTGSGIGHGLVFAGNLAEISVATPAAGRGGILGAVYFVNYAGLGVPVIGVGILSLWTGLLTATTVAAVVIATGCVLLIPLVHKPCGLDIGGFRGLSTFTRSASPSKTERQSGSANRVKMLFLVVSSSRRLDVDRFICLRAGQPVAAQIGPPIDVWAVTMLICDQCRRLPRAWMTFERTGSVAAIQSVLRRLPAEPAPSWSRVT